MMDVKKYIIGIKGIQAMMDLIKLTKVERIMICEIIIDSIARAPDTYKVDEECLIARKGVDRAREDVRNMLEEIFYTIFHNEKGKKIAN